MDQKKLVRPKEGRILFGVCQGIANYFNVDPIVVRLVFVILTIWGGAGIIIYIIGIFIIPDQKTIGDRVNDAKDRVKNAKEEAHRRVQSVASEVRDTIRQDESRLRGEQVFGLIILLVGIIFLFQNFFPWINFGKLWPLILVLFGLAIVARRRGR